MSRIDKDFIELVTNGRMKTGNNFGCGMICYKPETNSILVAKRTDTKNFCTAGGKVEVGETPLEGVLRETLEESGVKINSCICYDYRPHTSANGKNWLDFMFISTDFDDSKLKNQETEVEPWQWVTVEEALQMDLFPPTRRSLEIAQEMGLFASAAQYVNGSVNTEANGYFPGINHCDYAPNPHYTDNEGCSYSYCVGYERFI